MPYDEHLAERTREALSGQPGLTEKKMFGGLCFLIGGNMTCGITGETLMVRVGPDARTRARVLPPPVPARGPGRAPRSSATRTAPARQR